MTSTCASVGQQRGCAASTSAQQLSRPILAAKPRTLARTTSLRATHPRICASTITIVAQLRKSALCRSTQPDTDAQEEQDDDGFEGLLPEEDFTVPGGYQDSLSSNTPLGRAVREACDELDHLNKMEADVLGEATALLKKLGIKQTPIKPPPQQEQESQ